MIGQRQRTEKYKKSLLSGASIASYALVSACGLSLPWAEARAQNAPPTNAAPPADNARIEDVQVGWSADYSHEQTKAQETPRSVTVVNAKTIAQEHLICLDDFAQKLPNYRPNSTTPHASRAAIRGIGIGSGTGVGSQSATDFKVDDVSWIYPGFQWGDYIDLQSIEAALGPQGTAGGKNSTVGGIVLRTQMPSFDRSAVVETSYGSYGRTTSKVNATGPLVGDTLAYRLTAYFDRDHGYIHDQITGAGYANYNRWGVRGQLLYVGEAITDRLTFSYSHSDEYNEYTTNGGPIGDFTPIYANGTFASSSFTQNVRKRLGRLVLSYDPYKPYLSREGTDPARTIMVTNKLDWQIGDYNFTSISAYGFSRNQQHGYRDDNQELTIRYGGMDTYVGQGSQEFRLTSPKDQPLEWQIGLYALYEDAANQMHHTNFGADAAAWYSNPAALPGITDWWYTKAVDFQIAGFGQATYHHDEKLAVTFGLRDSFDAREGSVSHLPAVYYNSPYTVAQQTTAIINAGGWGFADTGGQTKELNSLAGNINPQYKYSDNILTYALVGRGQKSAAVNTSANPIYVNGVYNQTPPLFTKPDYSWSYELGLKTNWFDNTLIANVNLYWNDVFNFQTTQNKSTTDSTGSPVSVSYLGNAAHVRLRGVEFETRWSPLEKLWLNVTGAFTDSRYVSYPDAAPPTDWVWPKTASSIAAPTQLSLSNTRFTGIPIWAFNAGANYERPIGAAFRDFGLDRGLVAFGYANVAYYGKNQLTNPWSIIQYWQPAYALVNFGAGLRTDDGGYSLTFWAKNIANVRPWTSWATTTPSAPITVGLTTQPVTYGGTFQVKFD